MDPGEVPDIRDVARVVAQQAQQIKQQSQQIQQLTAALQQYTTAQPTPPPAASSTLRLALPSKFAGDSKLCRGFLTQCTMYIELLSSQFPSERSKVAFIISLLEDRALAWATPLWDRDDPIAANLRVFLAEFRLAFEEPARASSAESALLDLTQGSSSVGDYAIQFRTLAAELDWNEAALLATFKKGLSCRVKDALSARDLPTSLNDLILLATRVDTRFSEREEESRKEQRPNLSRRLPQLAPVFQSPAVPESPPIPEIPMQVDHARLSPDERVRRLELDLCLYCGGSGHYRQRCPERPQRSGERLHLGMVAVTSLGVKTASSGLSVPVTIQTPSGPRRLTTAVLDSGSAGSFIAASLVQKWRLPVIPLARPLYISSITGESLPDVVQYQTAPLVFQVGTLHQERIVFYVLPHSSSAILLGLPWLQKHSPKLDWSTGKILCWGQDCANRCLKSPPSKCFTMTPSSIKPLPVLPSRCQDLAEVVVASRATCAKPKKSSWVPESNAQDLVSPKPFLQSRKRGGPKGGGTVRAAAASDATDRRRTPSPVMAAAGFHVQGPGVAACSAPGGASPLLGPVSLCAGRRARPRLLGRARAGCLRFKGAVRP